MDAGPVAVARGPWVVAALVVVVAASVAGVLAINASVHHQQLGSITGDVELGTNPPAGSGGPPPPAAVNAVVQAVQAGNVVASTTTDRSGFFQMSVPVGTYSMHVAAYRCPTELVTVPQHPALDVRIHCAQ